MTASGVEGGNVVGVWAGVGMSGGDDRELWGVKRTARMPTAGSKIAGNRVNTIKRKLGTEDEEALFAQWKVGFLKTRAVPAARVVVIPVEDEDCIARYATSFF